MGSKLISVLCLGFIPFLPRSFYEKRIVSGGKTKRIGQINLSRSFFFVFVVVMLMSATRG